MPRVPRTPPKITVDSDMPDVSSEPDSAPQEQDEVISQKASRRRRPRLEASSPMDDFRLFKDEMKQMFLSFKAEQDKSYKKFLIEVREYQNSTPADMKKSIDYMSSKFDEMTAEFQEFKKTIREQREYIVCLETKIHDLENTSRTSSIEIRNIPRKDSEDLTELTSTVVKTAEATGISVSPQDLRDVYRLPGKAGTDRPIVAEFCKVHMKTEILVAARNFNKNKSPEQKLNTSHIGLACKRSPVFVSEYLPQYSRQLFYQAREIAKKNNFKFCWTSNGRIFLREDNGTKPLQVKTHKCLDYIFNKT